MLDASGVDSELLALETSSSMTWRRWVTFGVMALTAACAVILALMLRGDVAYVFSSATPRVIGDVLAANPATFESNQYARVQGAPMVSNAVYYSHALGGGEFVAFCLAGQRDVWVQVPVQTDDRQAALGQREFEGRLVRVGELGGRFDAVRRYMSGSMHRPMDADSWVLLAEEAPSDSIWSILAVLLVLGFVAVDAWLILRWFTPLPLEPKPQRELSAH